TRRQFSKWIVGSGLLASGNFRVAGEAPRSASPGAEQAGTQDCDLLMKDGKILELAPDIAASRALRVVSAKGKLVTPGLIDVHVHVFEGVGPTGLNADQYCLGRGVTTAVDAGSTGYADIAGFRQYVIKPSATRVYALVEIGARGTLLGLIGNYANLEWVNAQLTARAAEANKPDVVGIKVRLSREITGTNDLEILKRALEAAKISHLPLMVHVGVFYYSLP